MRDPSIARVGADFCHLPLVTTTNECEVKGREVGEQQCHRGDQLLPSFPVPHADLHDEEAIVGDPFLATEVLGAPAAGIESMDVGARVDHHHLRRRQLAAFDHYATDLFAHRDHSIDEPRAELGTIPDIERKRHAPIHHERPDRMAQRGGESKGMRDALVNMHDIGTGAGEQPRQLPCARKIELVPHAQAKEIDSRFACSPFQNRIRPADDGHLVPTLPQTGCRLEHLVHRPSVELVELEELNDPHASRS